MVMQLPYLLHPILKYKRVESKDYVIGFARNDLSSAILKMDDETFSDFCNEIMQLQEFRYKMNNTVGCESEADIPVLYRHEFRRVRYNNTSPLTFLPEHLEETNNPGVIIYNCLQTPKPKENLAQAINSMPDEQFALFIDAVARLEYFACLQNGSFFSWNPDHFDLEDERFWFIDEDFLSSEEDMPTIP